MTPREYLPVLRRALEQNIAAFWFPRCLDQQHGGYLLELGPEGQLLRPDPDKMIVTQARTVWLAARLARFGYKRDEMLQAAALGYRFLRERMWDARTGGFFWLVTRSGAKKRPDKHLYGQSFGLYGVAEYALASDSADVRRFASEIFETLERRAHDPEFGGYRESFDESWNELAADAAGPMGPGRLKLMNTHLHLLESFTTFYRATSLPLARERLLELITIESNTVVRKDLGACTDKYDRNWTPRLDGDWASVSYGHDIENVWLLMDACDAAGLPNAPLLDLYRALWSYTLRYGWDAQEGGLFYAGKFGQPAGRRTKEWWVQAEALISALRMWRVTGEARYWEVFEKTWDFINRRQIDWANGEWFATVAPGRPPGGDKAHQWKAGYHNGRALIECIELLSRV